MPAPRQVVELLDLDEIRERWGFSENRIYAAVARGDLHAYGRPGRQKYYSGAELVALFGEPPTGPRHNGSRDHKGGQLSFDELETAA